MMDKQQHEKQSERTVGQELLAAAEAAAVQEKQETVQERDSTFKKLALPALLFGLLATVLLYRNTASIAMPLFVLVAAAYGLHTMRLAGIDRPKRGSSFCLAVMLLLGISDCLTANRFIIACNNTGICLVLLTALIHNYCDDGNWRPGNWFAAMTRCLLGSVGCVDDAVRDACGGAKKLPRLNRNLLYALAGTAAAAPLLAIVTALLYSADERYAANLRLLASSVHLEEAGWVFLCFAACVLGAYSMVRFLWKRRINEGAGKPRQFPLAVALSPLALFCLVYLSFACSQFMEPPGGVTRYAAWAREGFFQLLTVSAINVLIVQLVLAHFKDALPLRILMLIFCACSYLMIASAGYRMVSYIRHYEALTFLRVLVLWTLALLSLLLSGQVVQLFRRDFPLFRYAFATVCTCYLILSLARVDYWIARYNLAHLPGESSLTEIARADRLERLSQLARDSSLDAVPAFAREGFLAADVENAGDAAHGQNYDRSVVIKICGEKLCERTADRKPSLRRWNLSVARARKLLPPQEGSAEE